jgi:hypothetical protein
MTFLRFMASSVVVAFLQSAPLDADEPTDTGVVSKHTSDLILTDIHKEDPKAPAPPPATVAPADVEPGVTKLEDYTVVDQPSPPKMDHAALTPKTEAIPLVWGTGVTEFKGKKHTILIRRFFWIPIAWKVKW